MLSRKSPTQKRVEGAVRTTRKAVNRALDAAEPKLENAAENLEDLGRDAARQARYYSKAAINELRRKTDDLESQVRKLSRRGEKHAKKNPGKAVLIAAGVSAILVGILR